MLNTLYKASKRVVCLIIEKSHLKIISLILTAVLYIVLWQEKKSSELTSPPAEVNTTGAQHGNRPLGM